MSVRKPAELAEGRDIELAWTLAHGTATALLGGVSSRFRVNPYTGRHLVVRRAHGPYLETSDGRTLIDVFMAHGSVILGHGQRDINAAVNAALADGVSSGYETGLAEAVAQRISAAVSSAEQVRFTASGSEAVLTAIRLARAVTGRSVVVKIDGQFNGTADYALFNSIAAFADPTNAGGRRSALRPFSAGLPNGLEQVVCAVPWNDLAALESVFEAFPGDVAAVVMVPIDFNNGCLLPAEGYLASVRELTSHHGSLLVFDEVLSGFKTGISCAQGLFGVEPDLTTLSKALSNGVPFSAVVGRAAVMATLAAPLPAGAIQGGTYAGNALGAAAALATLDLLGQPSFYPAFLERTECFFRALADVLARAPVPATVQWMGCGFGIYVGTREPVRSVRDIQALDPTLARRFFERCIERGAYFHTDFMISAAHDAAVLDDLLGRIEDAASAPLQ